MNNFIVPQFIDIEDRIFGPITIRQFLICTVGGLLVFAAFKLSDFSLFVFQAIFLVPITIVFAFVKVNGKNFHYFLLDLLIFYLKFPGWPFGKKKNLFLEKKLRTTEKKIHIFLNKNLYLGRN